MDFFGKQPLQRDEKEARKSIGITRYTYNPGLEKAFIGMNDTKRIAKERNI